MCNLIGKTVSGFPGPVINSGSWFLEMNEKIQSAPDVSILRFCFALCVLALCLLLAGCAEWKSRRHLPPAASEQMIPTAIKKDFVPDGYYEAIPPLPEKGYILEKLGKGVYFFSNGLYNNIFVVTPEGVVITDPIKGWGGQLKRAIKEVTSQPVKYMIYTHAHMDHIGDAHLFADEAQIVAHNETGWRLRRYKDPNRPIPNIGFGKNYTLTLGGTEIKLIYPGEGHFPGNIMVYLPQSKVLMYVDAATPRAMPSKNFAATDIFGQMTGIQKALKLDFKTYVAGHYHRPGTRQEMEEILKYYYSSRRANIAALTKVKFKDVASRSKSKDIQRRMGEYRDAVAEQCYIMLKNQWRHRLMGFEALARSHCDTWTTYHKTEKAPSVKKREE